MKKGLILCSILLMLISCSRRGTESEVPLILEKDPGSPLVTIEVRFITGSARDPEGKAGLHSLLASTIAHGGFINQDGDTVSYDEVIDRLYPMAARIDLVVDKEVTTFIGQVHKDFLDQFYQLFSRMILSPAFQFKDFQREKENHLNYIRNYLRSANDEQLGKEALVWYIYQNHPYAHPVQGLVSNLEQISLKDLKYWYQTDYTRRNVIIGIAGDVNSEFKERVQRDFSKLPDKSASVLILPEVERITGIQVLLVEKKTKSSAISLGFPLDITRANADFYPLYLANSYFGEHRTFTGRLMNKMRVQRGLNYGDYSYIEHFVQQGWSVFPSPHYPRHHQYFSIWIRPVLLTNAHFALRQALRELSLLVKDGLDSESFFITRDFLLNYSRLYAQTQDVRLGFKLDSYFYGTDYWIDILQERLSQLNLKEVNRAIKTHLQAKNVKVVMIVDDAEKFRQRLLSNQKSPITYQTVGTSEKVLREDKEIERYHLNVTEVRIVKADEIFN